MVDPVQPLQPLPPPQVQVVQTPRAVCNCAYCRIRSLFGPIMIITVGVVFLVGEYSRYSFRDLWPLLLIVAGILKVAENMAPREGHPAS
jgi:Domain of unknown function (DUF5668)